VAQAPSPLARIAEPRGRLASVLVPHQAGMPADMARIIAIAERVGIPVVEDAACALGSEIIAPKLGFTVRIGSPLSRAACFSMHPRKVISTAEGGMITSADPELMASVRMLRQHGMDRSTERHSDAAPTAESYPVLGFNYRLSDIQAAPARSNRLPAARNRGPLSRCTRSSRPDHAAGGPAFRQNQLSKLYRARGRRQSARNDGQAPAQRHCHTPWNRVLPSGSALCEAMGEGFAPGK
jgi:hypothetical protein